MCIDIRLRRSPCNPHNLSFRKEGGKVLRNYTGAGRACRVVIGAKMAALANDASSGRAGEENRERKQPQCSLDSIPFHFGGAVGVP